MLARDETPPILMEASDFGRKNLYGVYPFYMALELDGKAHGVLFLNSNPQKIYEIFTGGLMFADQFIQIAAYISSSNVYGIGENAQMQLRHRLDSYLTWAMLARDETPPILMEASDFGRKNLYGVYPFYMALELDGKAHGVLFLNSNPQEITTGPAPHIIYRTIGGILDIYFFPGPRPEDVIRQYLAFVGTPAVPPYWALGFQVNMFRWLLT
uniref:Gal_mutarotas_2 domain-containing protein n=1 Tax=Ascaris lumbricoides TaxID=6252 RepID=A0A0M3IWV7_ASCLU